MYDYEEYRQKMAEGERFTIVDYGIRFPDGTLVWHHNNYDLYVRGGRKDFLIEWRRGVRRLGVELSSVPEPEMVSRTLTIEFSEIRVESQE